MSNLKGLVKSALLACAVSGVTAGHAQTDPCTLLPDPGPCEAAIPAWYFDQDFGACTAFTWGGCGGTVPFESLEDCLAAECTGSGGLSGLCDSIGISVQSVGDASVGHLELLVSPEYATPYWFNYAGFALFDGEGELLAAEDVTTAPNAYGFDGNVDPHVRYLEYQAGVDLSTWADPFTLELRLYEGWMAGSPTERCTWTLDTFGTSLGMEPLPGHPGEAMWTTYDLLGRPAAPAPGRLLIERSAEGRVRKVISE